LLATKVRTEAVALGYAPLDAEAALGEGNLLMAMGRFADSEAALVTAVKLAIVHDMHMLAGEAAAKRIYVLSQGLYRHSEALAIYPVAEALVERARDDGRLKALLHNNLGVAYTLRGEYKQAQERYERTATLLQSRPGAPDPLLAATYHNLGELSVKQGKLDIARQRFTQAREQFVRTLGETHPIVAHPIAGLGDVDVMTGAYEDAARNYTQALVLMEAAHGLVHPYLLQPLVGLGNAYARRGQAAEARTNYGRVEAIADRLGLVDAYVGQALEGLGELTATEDPARARALFERAVVVQESVGGKDSGAQASAALRAGELAAQLGDQAAAIGWFDRVLALPADAVSRARPAAAVRLAILLAKQPEATARVCDLLAEARLSLTVTDPLQAEAEALRASRCGERPG
jgi:tetratricopeptide (TPR) repeat protein